jgi:16S rRNA (guanine966-N2)-methyltransferase
MSILSFCKPSPSDRVENKLRIIGGDWRSRQLRFADVPGLRPTPARVRETLFNWLQYDIIGSRCLDLYAGSGALGFEAASRGAGEVVQVENNPGACRFLTENARLLAASRLSVHALDVGLYLRRPAEPFDIVFMDPPFGLGLVPETCRLLDAHGWLTPRAKIYLESEKGLVLDKLPENWRLLKHKVAGEVAYRLFTPEQQ